MFTSKLFHDLISNDKCLFVEEQNHLKILLTSYFITNNDSDKENLLIAVNQYKNQREKVTLNELSVIHFKWKLTLIELLLKENNLEHKQESLTSKMHLFS